MYSVERGEKLLKLTFSSQVDRYEIEEFKSEVLRAAGHFDDEFFVFVDLRQLELFPPESQPRLMQTQRECRRLGMARSVVILSDAVTAMQLKRIAKQSGIYEWERYIDATQVTDWEEVGLAWLYDAVDPDAADRRQVSPLTDTTL